MTLHAHMQKSQIRMPLQFLMLRPWVKCVESIENRSVDEPK